MGKKRVIKKAVDTVTEKGPVVSAITSKKRLTRAFVYIYSTYNNTILTLTDEQGRAQLSNSSGRAGFSGSKKGTPYAASRAAEALADQARELGVTDLDIRVKGIGSGRESALRMFAQKGFAIHSIKDRTPIAHGTIRPPKPRRV